MNREAYNEAESIVFLELVAKVGEAGLEIQTLTRAARPSTTYVFVRRTCRHYPDFCNQF